MKTTKPLLLLLPLTSALALGGCSMNAMDGESISQMSCTELAREIGKNTQIKEDADADSIIGTVGALISDDKNDQITHSVEGIVGDISSASAGSELDKLKTAFNRRGCY